MSTAHASLGNYDCNSRFHKSCAIQQSGVASRRCQVRIFMFVSCPWVCVCVCVFFMYYRNTCVHTCVHTCVRSIATVIRDSECVELVDEMNLHQHARTEARTHACAHSCSYMVRLSHFPAQSVTITLLVAVGATRLCQSRL